MSTNPSGALRVSDADRDRAIAELSEHFQAGRITVEELEDRTGQALAARTAGELADLFTDLPRRKAPMTDEASYPTNPASPATPAPLAPLARTGSFPPALVPAVPLAILAIIVLGSLFSGFHGGLIAVPVLLVLLVVRRLGGGRRRDYRHDRA